MANPTINSKTLSTGGTHTVFHPPQSRITLSTLPGVSGSFVQRFGSGHQMIAGRGSISAASYLALKAAIRTIQNAANHAPLTYTDHDGSAHSNCILLDYQQAGDIKPVGDGTYWCRVNWTILKQVAD